MKKLSNFTTYQAGLLQARAYRTLKEFMVTKLRKYNLTMMKWAILGHVYDSQLEGVKVSELAKIIDVEISFITNMINQLEASKLVVRKHDRADKRVRRIIVTPKAKKLVEEVESDLRTEMRGWLSNINTPALLGYVMVLNKIVQKSNTT